MRTSTPHHGPRETSVTRDLDGVLAGISAGAAARDAEPAFPEGPFRGLAASGVLGMTAPRPRTARERPVSFEREWRVLRAVARADGSVGRILDGHFNAVEPLRARPGVPALLGVGGGGRRRVAAGRLGRGPASRGG